MSNIKKSVHINEIHMFLTDVYKGPMLLFFKIKMWRFPSKSKLLLFLPRTNKEYIKYITIKCTQFFSGVNLLIGTEHGLMLLDRSGQGKVYQLISRRRFQQMEVLEGQNILVTISGKKNRVRVYYLSWLKSKILRTDGVSDVSTWKYEHNLFI